MIKPRKDLEEQLEKYFSRIVSSPNEKKKNIIGIQKKHDIPYDVLYDYFSLKKSISESNDFILYSICEEVDQKFITTFFSDLEISRYSDLKFQKSELKFPIKFKMVEIVEGSQWIGKTTVSELMLLRENQLIRYNENTQRTLTKISQGETELFKISLNKSAIKQIKDSYLSGMYIPNTITLNIPEDAEFYYKDGYLYINEIESFDIVDGYHRYVAMSYLYNEDKDFDYTMELRITCHSESKARQFIFQEDQKTKMTKIDSASFNQNNSGNQVVSLLNQESILKGLITQKGIINDAELAALINGAIFRNKSVKRSEIVKVKNDLKAKLDEFCSLDPTYLDEKWDTQTIAAFVFACTVSDDIDLILQFNSIKQTIIEKDLFKVSSVIVHDIPRLRKMI